MRICKFRIHGACTDGGGRTESLGGRLTGVVKTINDFAIPNNNKGSFPRYAHGIWYTSAGPRNSVGHVLRALTIKHMAKAVKIEMQNC